MNSHELNAFQRMATALEKIAENTKQELPDESMLKEINDLKQIIRSFGMELQYLLDNPPRNGMEMAQRMRELAARMSVFGISVEFKGRGKE